MRNNFLDNYTRRFGDIKNVDVIEDKDVIKGRLEAVDNKGNSVTDGITVDDASLSVDLIADKKIKNKFIGLNKSESVDFDVKKAFPNENEIAGLLHKKKEEITDIDGNFRFTVNEITRFYPAELNKELFDKIYGEGVVTSEAEFMTKIEEEININLKRESDFRLNMDIKNLALEKTEFDLPEDFLKRWLLKVNENTTQEQIEQEFASFRKDLKWQLIRNKIARDNELKITEEELVKEAENITRFQFQQYGLYYATDEQISNYAKETLKREEDAKKIADKIVEEKVILMIRELVKLEPKSISIEDFNKLFE